MLYSMMTDIKPPRKQKQKETKSQPAPTGAERLKTVVRRLPPNLPEDIFWQSVQAWVTDDTITWKSYFPGKFRTKRMNREGIPSRAYIAFKSEEQVATFSREYDGHVFRDKAGNESQAIVEFAPFQKVPSEKKKVDARTNTIDKDEDYLSFLETLKNAGKTESVSLEALIAASQPPPPPTTTPLLEALKAEKSAQKDKEAILRNHAHYKDAGASGPVFKKEEAKKKAAVAVTSVQAVKPSEPPQPSSKKAKRAAAAAAATHKPLTAQAQDGQGGPTAAAAGKTQPANTAPSIAKPPSSIARHRPSKESYGRAHSGKGDTSVPLTIPTPSVLSKPGPGPASPTSAIAEIAPSNSPIQAAHTPGRGPGRKNRPMVGLGRQFEAALNGTGVGVSAVSPSPGGDRKKRDEGGGGRGKHREEGAVVQGMVQQRLEVGVPDVVIMQRPHSPKAEGLGHGPGREGSVGAGAARGGPRRGRGRGRGGHRGG